MIASALAQASDILLLDEPTASLDLGYQLEVASLLRRLNRDRGVTIAISTHDLNFAASVCRRLVMLREGRVIAAGPTAEVMTPEHIRAAVRCRRRRACPRRVRASGGRAHRARRGVAC